MRPAEGNIDASEWQDAEIRRGRRSGHAHIGVSQGTLGDLAVSIDESRSGDRSPKPRPGMLRPSSHGSE
jgi:hypothetical protein